jgi:hypothetical protein
MTLVHDRGQRTGVTLAMTAQRERCELWLSAAPGRERQIADQLLNAYPGSAVTPLPRSMTTIPAGFMAWSRTLQLTPPFAPLAGVSPFMDPSTREVNDPVTTLFTALLANRSSGIHSSIVLHVRPAREPYVKRSLRLSRFWSRSVTDHDLRHALVHRACDDPFMTRLVARSLLRFMTPISEPDQVVSQKLSGPLLEVQITLLVTAPVHDRSNTERTLGQLAQAMTPFTAGQSRFTLGPLRRSHAWPDLRSGPGPSFLATPAEVALLWHPPLATVAAPKIDRLAVRELEPPESFAAGGGESAVLGRVRFRDDRRLVRLDANARRTHTLIIGRSGSGKSTLLQSLVLDDLIHDRGVALIDPHHDLAESVLDAVPPRRTNDVIYFDAGDATHAVAFNPLSVPRGGDPGLVAEGVLAAFQKVFGLEEGSAPRLLHILRNALHSLVGQPDATLLSIQRILVDAMYRKTVVGRVTSPIVRAFWTTEFEKWRPADRTEYIASLQNKLGAFLTNARLQRILGQPRGRIDLRSVMDRGQILVVNLSKGRVGESAANLLGSLLVSSLQLAAMSRADLPLEKRRDFSVVIDEFQNFTNPSIATAFAEARKVRCNFVVAHQYLSQLTDEIRDAVVGNAGTMVVFGVAADDAEYFARQLGGQLTADDVRALPRYHAYVRLPEAESRPFLMTTLPPSPVRRPRGELIRRLARERVARPVHEVDAQIRGLVG